MTFAGADALIVMVGLASGVGMLGWHLSRRQGSAAFGGRREPIAALPAPASWEPLYPSGMTAGALAAAFADREAERLAAPDRTPEPGVECAPALPDRTPVRLLRAPKRTLRWYEVPSLTLEYVLDLGEDCFDEHGRPAPLEAGHSMAEHVSRLLFFILSPEANYQLDDPPICIGKVERGLFAFQAEQAYLAMCLEEWWRPYRWEGTGGVAEHFRRHLKRCGGGRRRRGKPAYKYVIREDGLQHRQAFYPIPQADDVLGPRPIGKGAKRAPKRTPRLGSKRTPSRSQGERERRAA